MSIVIFSSSSALLKCHHESRNPPRHCLVLMVYSVSRHQNLSISSSSQSRQQQVVIWYVETGQIIDLQIRILTAVLPSTGSAVAGQHFLKQTVSSIAVTTTKCASSYLNDAAPLLTWCWCSSLDFIRFIIANNPRTRNSLSFVGTDDTHWYHTTWLIAGLCTTTQQNYILMLMSLTSVKISSLEPSHEWACLLLLFPDEDSKVTELREPRACS